MDEREQAALRPVDKAQLKAVDISTQLAAERTLLAWVRTGLAMMGFGFVVARFGLFLRELGSTEEGSPSHRGGVSLWVGIVLLFFGAAVNIAAAVEHARLLEQLRRGKLTEARVRDMPLKFVVPGLLAVFGLVMAIYLFVMRAA